VKPTVKNQLVFGLDLVFGSMVVLLIMLDGSAYLHQALPPYLHHAL